MRRLTTVLAVGVLGVGLAACSSPGGNGGQGDADTQVGPVSFELPDGLDEVFHDDNRTSGWVAEYSDNEDSPS